MFAHIYIYAHYICNVYIYIHGSPIYGAEAGLREGQLRSWVFAAKMPEINLRPESPEPLHKSVFQQSAPQLRPQPSAVAIVCSACRETSWVQSACTYLLTCIYIYTHTHPPTHTCLHMCMYIYIYLYVCMYVCAYTYTHKNTYEYLHVNIYSCNYVSSTCYAHTRICAVEPQNINLKSLQLQILIVRNILS